MISGELMQRHGSRRRKRGSACLTGPVGPVGLIGALLAGGSVSSARADVVAEASSRCPRLVPDSEEVFLRQPPSLHPAKTNYPPDDQLFYLLNTYGGQLRKGADSKDPQQRSVAIRLLNAAIGNFECILGAAPQIGIRSSDLFAIRLTQMQLKLLLSTILGAGSPSLVEQSQLRLMFIEITDFVLRTSHQNASMLVSTRHSLAAMAREAYKLRLEKIGLLKLVLLDTRNRDREVPIDAVGGISRSEIELSEKRFNTVTGEDEKAKIPLLEQGFFLLPIGVHNLRLKIKGYEDRAQIFSEDTFSVKAKCESSGEPAVPPLAPSPPAPPAPPALAGPPAPSGRPALDKTAILLGAATRPTPRLEQLDSLTRRYDAIFKTIKDPANPGSAMAELTQILDRQFELLEEGRQCVALQEILAFKVRKKRLVESAVFWTVIGAIVTSSAVAIGLSVAATPKVTELR